jgi:murein DD-endopeptidase MepM/ murein hydrolase activator NlpD
MDEAWIPFSQAGPVVLRLPSNRVEAVGYHQSNLDGAQVQSPLPGGPRWFVMGDRERDTNPMGAADVVVEPGTEVRAPVSGTVLRAGSYTLYCNYTDEYLVIAPDSRPGWEVKLLHIQGLQVSKGQRVEAGVTVVAAHAHVLPFPSQVEDNTGVPPWPHVHMEVDDPSIPDRPGKPCSG